MRQTLFVGACLGALALLGGGATHAALIVDLNPGDAAFSYVDGGTATGSGSAVRANGHTVNATITPGAEDVTGTVVIFEYGGTSNGFNLGLVDGVLTYMAKHNSGDANAPDSLNDTSLRPDGSTSGEAAVQHSYGALTAGETYSIAVAWDQAGTLLLGLEAGGVIARNTFGLTGVYDNWSGNNSISVGVINASAGGYGGELAGTTVADPFDVDETPVSSFTGTVNDLLYWNDAGGVIPEPSTIALASLCALGLGAIRRR